MTKSIKKFSIYSLIVFVFLFQGIQIHAEEPYAVAAYGYTPYAICPYSVPVDYTQQSADRASSKAYSYASTSVSSSPSISKSGEFDNRSGSLPQSKTVSFTRTFSFTGSITTTAEAGAIFAKVGVSAEASLGYSSSVTTSTTFNIGAGKYGYYQVGSKRTVTSGKMTVYNLATCTAGSPYTVSVSFTTGMYDKYWEK